MKEIKKLSVFTVEHEDKDSDVAFTKRLFINGKQVTSCQNVILDFDISEPITKVTCVFVIKKDSLKIEDHKISFDLGWKETDNAND